MLKLRNMIMFAAILLLAVACRKTNVSVNPSMVEFSAEGGTIDVAVTSNGDWTLSECPEWVTASAMTGSGDATLSLTTSQNTTGADRSGRISLVTEHNSAVIEIAQKTFSEHFLTVSPNFFDANINGDSLTLMISASAPWSIACSMSWVTIEPQNGEGTAQVKVNVASGVSGDFDLREATIEVACAGLSQTVQIFQPHSEAIMAYPNSFNFSCQEGEQTFFLHAPEQWEVNNCPDWISVVPEQGEGSCFVAVHVNENPLTDDRFDNPIITMGDERVVLNVHQEGVNSLNYINVDSQNIFFSYEGGSREVSVSCNRDWNVTTDCDWLSIAPLSGTGDGSILIEARENPYVNNDRSGTVTLTSHDLTAEILVGQNSGNIVPSIAIDVTNHTMTFDNTAGSQTVNVTANVPWTVTCAESWVTITPSSGNGNGSFTVSVQDNESFETRNAQALIESLAGTVRLYIIQNGQEATVQVDVNELHVPLAGGEFTVNVTANQPWKVSCDEWMSCNPQSGTGNGSFVITVTPSLLSNERIGEVSVTGIYGGSQSIHVIQSGVY